MGRELLDRHPGFRERMEACDAAVRAVTGWSVLDVLAEPAETSRVDEVDIQQPALFALQVSLAALWTDLGLRPAALVGHSIGEVAAACVGGALSLEDGARIAAARSHLIQHALGPGAMTAVELPEEELIRHLAPYEGQASIAAFNSPTSIAVAGTPQAIRALEEDLRRAGTSARSLRVERAGHCVLMDPILEPLRERLQGLTPYPFEVPFRSTALHGTVNPVVGPDYWVRNLRNPVRFAPTIEALVDDGVDTFVEIGPHGALRGVIEQIGAARGVVLHVVDSLRRGASDTRAILSSAASLFTRGVPLSMATLYPEGARLTGAPLVRWQRERHWLGTVSPGRDAERAAAALPVGGNDTSADRAAEAVATTAAPDRTPRDIILTEIAELLGIRPDGLASDARLQDFGLDSMLAIRLSNRLQTLFGHRVSPAEYLRGEALADLLDRLAELVAGPAEPGTPERAFGDGAKGAESVARDSFVDDLTDEDAGELMADLVARGLLTADAGTVPARESLRAALTQPGAFELAPAGHGQGAIWFMQQLSPDGAAYNLMFAARVAAAVDEDALDRAVQAVVERHPALRTVFVDVAGRPFQLIPAAAEYDFRTLDASGLSDEDVHDLLVAHGHEPMDLDRGPILRVALLTRGTEDHFLLVVIHHAAADAASVDVVIRDLRDFYAQALDGGPGPQEPVAPYTEFVEWERTWLRQPEAAEALAWWSKQLGDPPAHLDLPGSRASADGREEGVDYAGADMTFRWAARETQELKEFALGAGVSVSSLVLAGFFATLNRATGAEDAIVATAVAQRDLAGRENAVGYYLNTAPVRARPCGGSTFRELLSEVHAFSLGLLEHMNYPLDLLVRELNPPRPQGRTPWFDFAVNWLSGDSFTYANTLFHGVGGSVGTSEALPLVPLPLRRDIAKFDLEITMADVGAEVVGQVQYKPTLVERENVTMFLERFRSVLFQAIAGPDVPLDTLGTAPSPSGSNGADE